MTKPIGILGGTFDPVHHGHLRLAVDVLNACVLEQVSLIPLHIPAHRQNPIASVQQRLQMLRLAIEGVSGLAVDERELERASVSFTLDTLCSIREEVGEQPLCLIMGMDAFQKLNSWYEWKSLSEYVHILVAGRPGVEAEIENADVRRFYEQHRTEVVSDLHTNKAGQIYNVEISELNISSTKIRELIMTKQDAHFLLPENVLSYIEKEDLYHRH
jgi:nicotinate-nucleotide adenylyltransferase